MNAVMRGRLGPSEALLAITATMISVAGGFLVTTHYALSVLGIVAGILFVTVIIRRLGRGAWFGLLVLGALDALPGPSLETTKGAYGFTATDVVITILIISSLVDNAGDRFTRIRRSKAGPTLICWSVSFLALWIVTVLRSDIADDIPIRIGAAFGRDFLYYSLLVPLMIGSLANKQTRSAFLLVVTVGAVVVAIGQIIVTLGISHLSFIIHQNRLLAEGDLMRVYSPAKDLIAASVTLAAGGLFLSRNKRMRWTAGFIVLIMVATVALLLTRALYLGEVVGIAAALTVWVILDFGSVGIGRQSLAKLAGLVIVLAICITVYHPSGETNSPATTVVNRFNSFFSATSSSNFQTSTVAYRERLDTILLTRLGGQWLFGLGFLSPKIHYELNLPKGSIRNSDTGVFNALMTMGIVGAALIYIPVVAVAVILMWQRLVRRRDADSWLAFGVFAWCILVLFTSVSLVTLFSVAGLVLSAAMLALGMSCTQTIASSS